MKTIGIILKKELRRFFTDRRMILGIVLPGILIFVLYSVMGNFMNKPQPEISEISMVVENEPKELKPVLEQGLKNYKVTLLEGDFSEEELRLKVEKKELDLYVIYPTATMSNKNIDIFYNSSSNSSSFAYTLYTGILNAYEDSMLNLFNINQRDIKYDLANEADLTVQIFTMMLPFLLITFLFSGAMGICSESISGEKERGTIATLLVTPAKRSSIAIGKVASLGIVALTSGIISFLGLLAALPRLVGANLSFAAYNFQTILLLLLVIILTVLFFTVLLTMVSTYARSVKEASSLSIPVMILVMLLGATSFMGTTAQTNPALYLIPVYGAIQSLTGILSMTLNPVCFILYVLSSIVYISLGVFALTKMFNSEKIIFNN